MAVTRDYRYDRSDLVCDRCDDIIDSAFANSIEEAESQLPIAEHLELRAEHECTKCRKRRERETLWQTGVM